MVLCWVLKASGWVCTSAGWGWWTLITKYLQHVCPIIFIHPLPHYTHLKYTYITPLDQIPEALPALYIYPLGTSPAGGGCPVALGTSPAGGGCPVALGTSPAGGGCPVALGTSPAGGGCPVALATREWLSGGTWDQGEVSKLDIPHMTFVKRLSHNIYFSIPAVLVWGEQVH